jgi:cellulose synthase (UDP-forming)
MIIIVAKAILTLIILFFVAYALLEWRLILLSKKSQRVFLKELGQSPLASLNEKGTPDNAVWPTVTILLPVYNESKVVEALIDAVCAMRYPAERMQVLVLDDSTDQTTLLAAVKAQHYAKQGVNIAIIKRKKRLNYKAGNLANGLLYSTGEFLAVFDADFIPHQIFY